MNLIANFPGVPRAIQVDAINEIEEAIRANKKFIILCAPTGSGKSHIAASVSLSCKSPPKRFIDMVDDQTIFQRDGHKGYIHDSKAVAAGYHRGCVLTVTKALQDQYKELFGDNVAILKGKNNYECIIEPTLTCDMAFCSTEKQECDSKGGCPYYNARNKALISKFSVMNYSMALHLPDHVMQTEFLICDEASELEDELVGHFSVEINYKQLMTAMGVNTINKLLSEDPKDGMKWLTKLNEDLTYIVIQLEKDVLLKRNKRTKKFNKELKRYRYLNELSNKIRLLLSNWFKSQIIIEHTGDDVSFVPLHVNNLAHMLFDRARHVILMAAVIIDPAHLAKQLGIDDYAYIELGSVFDHEKSPIYCSAAKYDLGYNKIDKNLPHIANQIKKIVEHYKDSKGVIHTHNFKINEYLRQFFRGDRRFIYREAGINNEKLLEIHKNRKDPTVLVSPSLAYGTDLPDELGRFQIVVKLPYPPLGSKRIKTLFDKDKVWYKNKMLTTLIQSCGRCTRHSNDHSDTFILDGQILRVLKENWIKLAKFFKDRIH